MIRAALLVHHHFDLCPRILILLSLLVLNTRTQTSVFLPPDSWGNDFRIDPNHLIELEANTTYRINRNDFLDFTPLVQFRFNVTEPGHRLRITHHDVEVVGDDYSTLRDSADSEDYTLFTAICYACNRIWESTTTSQNLDILKVGNMQLSSYIIEYNVVQWTRSRQVEKFGDMEVSFSPEYVKMTECPLGSVLSAREGHISLLDYEPNTYCEWHIKPDSISEGEQVFIRLIAVDIEAFYDVFEIYDGNSSASSSLLVDTNILVESVDTSIRITIGDWPLVRSRSQSLFVKFASDGDVQLDGIEFEWFVKLDRQMEAAIAMNSSAVDIWNLDPSVHVCDQDLQGLSCLWNSVVDFDTGEAGASGQIPSEIEYFDELRRLYCFQRPTFPGVLPETIGSLSNLRVLLLQSCLLQHPLPRNIAHLKSLVSIRMSPCDGRGVLPDLSMLVDLQVISITSCNLDDEDLSWVSSLPVIEQIYIGNNNISGQLPDFHPQLNNITSDLEYVAFSAYSNSLTGEIPRSWSTTDFFLLQLEMNNFTCPVMDYNTFAEVGDSSYYRTPLACSGGELTELMSIASRLKISTWDFDDTYHCDLGGVTCHSDDDHVIALNFSGLGLEGFLSRDLVSGLSHLESITIGDNPLLYCPIENYALWANQTDFDASRSCFECDSNSLLLQSENAVRNTTTCPRNVAVGGQCTLQCDSLHDVVRGDHVFTCTGGEGFSGEPLICGERCSLSDTVTNHIAVAAGSDCHNDARGDVCNVECQPGFIPVLQVNGSDPGVDTLTCDVVNGALQYDRPPLHCTSPCRISAETLELNRIVIVDGCKGDGQGDVCATQCRQRAILDHGSHENTCHFIDTTFQYSGQIAYCDDADFRIAAAAQVGVLVVGVCIATFMFRRIRDFQTSLIVITVFLALLDFVSHVLFVVERFGKVDTDGRFSYVVLALCFVLLSVVGNLSLVFYVGRMLLKSSSDFRGWISGHELESAALVVLSAANAETVSLLAYDDRGSTNGKDDPTSMKSRAKQKLHAKIRRLLQVGALLVNLFEDIPLLCLQIAFVTWTHFTTISFVALIATICSASFAILKYCMVVWRITDEEFNGSKNASTVHEAPRRPPQANAEEHDHTSSLSSLATTSESKEYSGDTEHDSQLFPSEPHRSNLNSAQKTLDETSSSSPSRSENSLTISSLSSFGDL